MTHALRAAVVAVGAFIALTATATPATTATATTDGVRPFYAPTAQLDPSDVIDIRATPWSGVN